MTLLSPAPLLWALLQESPPPGIEDWTLADWLLVLLAAAFFLFVGLGAWRLRRIKKTGLLGHDHRVQRRGAWDLVWPGWWAEPAERGSGWAAATNDHDGRVFLQEIPEELARLEPEDFLARFTTDQGFRLDDWDVEELAGAHGTIHIVESRADTGTGRRAYLWVARVPGPEPGGALLLLYRSSVLYGLADGYWLNEVASRARLGPPAASPAPAALLALAGALLTACSPSGSTEHPLAAELVPQPPSALPAALLGDGPAPPALDPVLPGAALEILPAELELGAPMPRLALRLDTGDEPLAAGTRLVVAFAVADHGMFDEEDLEVECSRAELGYSWEVKNLAGRPRLLRILLEEDCAPHTGFRIGAGPAQEGRTGWLATSGLLWAAHCVEAGDGSGRFRLIETHGAARRPRAPYRLNATATSTLPVGGELRLHVGVVDVAGNPAFGFEGPAGVSWSDGRVEELPAGALAGSWAVLRRPAEDEEILRAVVRAAGLQPSESNPAWVHQPGRLGGRALFFGDEQVHTRRSDGSLSLREMLERIRSWGACDWVAITDHDRLAPFPLDASAWERAFRFTREFARGGPTVVPAFEWTRPFGPAPGEPHGHRCVLAADWESLVPVPDSTDPAFDTLDELNEVLAERGAVFALIPHHLPHYRWWKAQGLDDAARDRAQPVAEVFSRTHGNYESDFDPWWPTHAVSGTPPLSNTSWRVGLERGVRSGAAGGSDNHAGYGGYWLRPLGYALTAEEAAAHSYESEKANQVTRGTFTAVLAEENTPAALVGALGARRSYATSGPRILLWFTAAGEPFGSVARLPATAAVELRAEVFAEAPLLEVEIFRVTPRATRRVLVHDFRGQELRDVLIEHTDPPPEPPAPWRAYYCRVRQEGCRAPGGEPGEERAISSPVWLESP